MAARTSRVAVRREVRLSAPPELEVPDLERLAEAYGLSHVVETTEPRTSEYFDTAELALIRRGVTLQRTRDSVGSDGTSAWILELPRPAKSGTNRAECRLVEVRDPATSPPAPVRDLLLAYVRDADLSGVTCLETVRTSRQMQDARGDAIAQIDDDVTAVVEQESVAARFRHLEIDVDADAPDGLLEALIEVLRQGGAAAPDPMPTPVRALGPRALVPLALERRDAGPDDPAGDVVVAGLIAATNLLLDHDHVIRLDDDIEGVHQARVGTRRLRSALRTFGSLFHDEPMAPLRDELKVLAGALGEVRDHDVLRIRIRRAIDELTDKDDRQDAAPLLERLDDERAEAQARLLTALRSERYVALLDQLVAAVTKPPLKKRAHKRATKRLPPLVQKPYLRVLEGVEQMGLDPADEQLHALRIKVKRARYAAELAAPALGREVKTFAKDLAALGDLLGDHHDASFAEGWLRTCSTPDTALVAGQLVAAQRDERRRIRRELPAAWEQVTLADPFA